MALMTPSDDHVAMALGGNVERREKNPSFYIINMQHHHHEQRGVSRPSNQAVIKAPTKKRKKKKAGTPHPHPTVLSSLNQKEKKKEKKRAQGEEKTLVLFTDKMPAHLPRVGQ